MVVGAVSNCTFNVVIPEGKVICLIAPNTMVLYLFPRFPSTTMASGITLTLKSVALHCPMTGILKPSGPLAPL